VANLRDVSKKLNETLDPSTQDALRSGIRQFAKASAQLNTGLSQAAPLFRDLGATVEAQPATDFGQTVRRLNLITNDVNLLTQTLRDRNGKLNQDGSLQKLITRSDLYENMNRFAVAGTHAFDGIRPILAAFRIFAEKISRDPSSISKGALSR
jgi:phospholipid/cholesterol/gamma-HCH transport system substrate-binding protein